MSHVRVRAVSLLQPLPAPPVPPALPTPREAHVKRQLYWGEPLDVRIARMAWRRLIVDAGLEHESQTWSGLTALRGVLIRAMLAAGFSCRVVSQAAGVDFSTVTYQRDRANPTRNPASPTKAAREAMERVGCSDAVFRVAPGNRQASRSVPAVAQRAAVYVLMRSWGFSFPAIARALGVPNHSTVVCAVHRMQERSQALKTARRA